MPSSGPLEYCISHLVGVDKVCPWGLGYLKSALEFFCLFSTFLLHWKPSNIIHPFFPQYHICFPECLSENKNIPWSATQCCKLSGDLKKKSEMRIFSNTSLLQNWVNWGRDWALALSVCLLSLVWGWGGALWMDGCHHKKSFALWEFVMVGDAFAEGEELKYSLKSWVLFLHNWKSCGHARGKSNVSEMVNYRSLHKRK